MIIRTYEILVGSIETKNVNGLVSFFENYVLKLPLGYCVDFDSVIGFSKIIDSKTAKTLEDGTVYLKGVPSSFFALAMLNPFLNEIKDATLFEVLDNREVFRYTFDSKNKTFIQEVSE